MCQQADDDDDHDVGGDFSTEPSDFSQTCSQVSFSNDSIFDTTILQGDRLVAQPHKVSKTCIFIVNDSFLELGMPKYISYIVHPQTILTLSKDDTYC